MAVTCTQDALQAGAKCLVCNYSEHELKVLKIWFMAKLAEGLGASELTLDTMLEQVIGFESESDKTLLAYEVAALQEAASTAGATLDGTDVGDLGPSDLNAALAQWFKIAPKTVQAGIAFGTCQVLASLP